MALHILGLFLTIIGFVLFFVYLVKTDTEDDKELTAIEWIVSGLIVGLMGYFFWSVVIDILGWLV